MKDNAVYGALGLFAIIALFALIGQIAAGGSVNFKFQMESAIALGLVGVNCGLNALVWWRLPPRKLRTFAASAGRCLLALVLSAVTIVIVVGLFLLIAEISINDSHLFGGDSVFAIVGTIGGSVVCSALSSIVYLIAQIVVPKDQS